MKTKQKDSAKQRAIAALLGEVDSAISDLESLRFAVNELEETFVDSDQFFECQQSLEEYLGHCKLRGERPTVSAVEAGLNGKSFGYLLALHSQEVAP